MTQHTPGPWQHRPKSAGSHRDMIRGEHDAFVAEIHAAGPNYVDNIALIAAAPELLEAVKRFLKCHDQDRDYSDMSWDDARAAIAKAEGSATP